MIDLHLQQKEHNTKIGAVCPYIKPNVTEDSIFYVDGEAIGFFLTKMPDKMCQLAEIANHEFQSDNVPKSLLERSDIIAKNKESGISRKQLAKMGLGTAQMSCIIGSIPPKPHMKRLYPSISSVHKVKTAANYIKAMLLLAKESELLIKEIIPKQYETQLQLFKQVPEKWKFGNLFTSSISNYNISASFHKDNGNIVGAVNVIICKRLNSFGGDLHIPDYNATIGQEDNSILVYPAWKNIHGVTPITPTFEGGYRNSLIFYPLRAFVNI